MRLGFLHEAKTYYSKFLVSAEQYEIVKTRKRDKETSGNDDPAAMRLAKVQRFKYIRELEQQTSIKTLIEEHTDEELQRQRRLLFLKLLAAKAEDALELIEAELRLLKLDGSNHCSSSTSPRPLHTKVSTVTRPFVLTKTRADVASTVFRPGHNLPTMTIDEYLELEHRHGNIKSQSLDEGNQPGTPPGEDEEVERQKLIQRDEWLDEHRRGEGNTFNRS